MSSWLGGVQWGSLSGQISSFAKEVLTEAEEEVQDPVAELQVAKSRITELEESLGGSNNEVERLRKYADELSDRAETAEYQIAAISQEYRKLIQEKDEQIKSLKSENLKLEEKGSSGFLSTTEPFTSVPKVTSAALLSAEEGLVEVNLHDEYDGPSWTEGMSVQNQEIKRLEEEVAYLKDQCDRWRRQAEGEEKEDAEQLQVIVPVISEQEEIATLKDEIENLNGNLLEERDSHKHQIATLQDQHKDSLQSLQKIHRQELDKLQMVIQGLKQDLEEANQKLALKESKSDSQEKLATEKQNLQSEITSLEERMEKEKSQKEELTANLTSLRGETEALSQHVNALSQQLAEKSAETDLLKLEYTASEERFRDLTSQLAALKTSNTELEQHNKLLLRDLQAANSSTRSLSEREQRNVHELASAMVKLKSDLPIAKKTVRITLSAMSEGISKSFASLTTAIRSHLEREGERARAIADQLRSVEEQYTQVSQELEEVRRSGVEQPSGWDDEGWNTSGTQVSDLEEKIRELEKQVQLEISSKERLKEHLTRISADHDAELSELVEERDRLQASVCEFEKMNSSQTKDDSFWQSSEGGWDDWSSEGRGAQWTPEEDKVDMSQDQVASEKWKKYGEPVLEALSKTLGNFSEPTHEDIDNMVAILRERGALQSQLKEVERSLDQSRDEVALKEQLLEQTTQQLQTNREAYTNVETEKEDLKKETAKLQAELDDSRRRFKEVRVQLLEKTRECTEHSEEKGRMEVQLGESLRVKEGLMSSTAAERLQAQQDHQQLLLDVEEKTSSLANLQAVVSEKDIELAKMQEERMEFEEQQSQLMQVFAEANQKLREKDLETTSLQKQLENVREEASQLQVNQEARDKLEEEVTSLRGLLHQAESKVEVHKQEAMKLEGKISELLQLLQVKEEEMVLLSRENTKKEEVLRGVTKEENKMSSQLNERVLVLEGALQQARTELTNIESQHMATVSALEESLAKTASENRNKDVDVSELREELKKTVEERKKLETDFINLRAQNQLLSQKASELEAEIIRLKGVIATGQDAKDSSLKVLEAQLTAVSAERDQVLSTLGEIGKENGLLKEELATMKDAHQQSAQKNSEDVQRLKRHLLQVDEHYTQEAVKAEEREIELRQKLSTLEEEMSRTTLSEQASIHQRDQEVVSLQQQLHVLAQQRDDAVIKLSTTQDEVEQTQHELSNLQMVLEQFQKDHTAEVNAALQLSRVELLKAETDKEGMRHEIDQLKGQLREASFSLENASHLEHELELREKQYEELQQKVKELQDNLGASQLQITQLTSQDEDKVDKNLVKNLLHGYLTAPDRKKGEVLKLIANILGMSEQAISQATRSRSWLSGWFGGPVPQSPTSQGVSFTEMFVTFLENESKKAKSVPESGNHGYIDPRTDPDRPSLATTSLHPITAMNPRPPPVSAHQDPLTQSPATLLTGSSSSTGSTSMKTGSGLSTDSTSAKTGSGLSTGSTGVKTGSVPYTGSVSSHAGSFSLAGSNQPADSPVPVGGLVTLSTPSQPVVTTSTSLQTSLLKNILSN